VGLRTTSKRFSVVIAASMLTASGAFASGCASSDASATKNGNPEARTLAKKACREYLPARSGVEVAKAVGAVVKDNRVALGLAKQASDLDSKWSLLQGSYSVLVDSWNRIEKVTGPDLVWIPSNITPTLQEQLRPILDEVVPRSNGAQTIIRSICALA